MVDLAGRAVISATYADLNLRFGYHVVVLDAVCGQVSADNYIVLRQCDKKLWVRRRR